VVEEMGTPVHRETFAMRLLATFVLLFATASLALAEDTPAAAKTRKVLMAKVKEIDWKDTMLDDARQELQEEVKGLFIILDTKGGISKNRKISSLKAKDKTVEEILNTMCDTLGGVGYIVVSQKGNARDGNIMIRLGKERGTEVKK
jgi:membrane-bound ClpP family serine protease